MLLEEPLPELPAKELPPKELRMLYFIDAEISIRKSFLLTKKAEGS